METLGAALWAANLDRPLGSLAAWLDAVAAHMAEAAGHGAGLLMMPEFACAQWLAYAPPGDPAAAIPWLAAQAREAAPVLAELAVRHGMALLPGTFPVPDPNGGGRFRNQAWLFLPDGRTEVQDKLCLTPSEEAAFSRGTEVRLVRWAGIRLAVVICLDVEVTALWARLGPLDLDLVLIPAKTDMVSGFHRVFGCAKARAIELQVPVCVVGAVGVPLGPTHLDTGMGGAAAYLPCEASLGAIGIAAAFGPVAAASGQSPVLHTGPLPIGACRRIRHGAAEAEVWPGSWQLDHVTVHDPDKAT
jgi:predicted amidohydrolase